MPPPREQVRTSPPRWWAFVLAGACHAGFTALAFPPAGVWVLALFAPAPLIWAGCRATRNVMRCALLTALGVLPLWMYEQSWLWDVTEIGYPLLVLYLSAYSGVFVWLFALVRRNWLPKGRLSPLLPACVIAPLVWMTLEMIRGEVLFGGYPWYLAGHPLIESARLAAPASLLGAYFVSFLVVALAGALADAAGWMGMARGIGGIGAAATLAVWAIASAIGYTGPAPAGSPVARVGVVQTNVPQNNKIRWKDEDRDRSAQEFAQLTRDAAAARPRPDLIVWPETMFPGEALNESFARDLEKAFRDRGTDPASSYALAFIRGITQLQQELGVPMIVGAQAIEGLRIGKGEDGKPVVDFDRRFNSAFLIQQGRVSDERYDKIDLTPFGEIIPYAWRWKRLEQLVERIGARGMKFDLSMGDRATVFSVEIGASRGQPKPKESCRYLEFVTPICFEATKSELCRQLAYHDGRRRCGAIINLSNDGWFGPTSGVFGFLAGGRQQHLQAARWRCVELGVPMVRAVNTGISASIDRMGKLRQLGPENRESAVDVEGVMLATVSVAPEDEGTVFGRIGNVFGWGAAGMGVFLAPLGAFVRRLRANRPTASA